MRLPMGGKGSRLSYIPISQIVLYTHLGYFAVWYILKKQADVSERQEAAAGNGSSVDVREQPVVVRG